MLRGFLSVNGTVAGADRRSCTVIRSLTAALDFGFMSHDSQHAEPASLSMGWRLGSGGLTTPGQKMCVHDGSNLLRNFGA
jgi:hypothetical protein